MNTNKIIAMAVGVTVGLILISSLLIPTVQATEYNRTTYNNNGAITGVYPMSDRQVDFDFEIYDGGIRGTMDGQSVDFPVKSRENFIICSDKVVFLESFSTSSNPIKGSYGWFFNDNGTATDYVSTNPSVGGHIKYDAATKTVEYTKDSTHYSTTIEWMYHIDTNGPYRTYQTSAPWYANTNDLIVAGGGYYSTGDNDTTYSYYSFNKDEFTTSGPYDCELNITQETVAEDIAKCNITVDIGGESFTPWNVIIPTTVTSTEHEDWEAMLSIIPMLAIVFLVVAIAAHIKTRP